MLILSYGAPNIPRFMLKSYSLFMISTVLNPSFIEVMQWKNTCTTLLRRRGSKSCALALSTLFTMLSNVLSWLRCKDHAHENTYSFFLMALGHQYKQAQVYPQKLREKVSIRLYSIIPHSIGMKLVHKVECWHNVHQNNCAVDDEMLFSTWCLWKSMSIAQSPKCHALHTWISYWLNRLNMTLNILVHQREPTASYRWAGWVWKLISSSSRLKASRWSF